jgi:hypothetical protein
LSVSLMVLAVCVPAGAVEHEDAVLDSPLAPWAGGVGLALPVAAQIQGMVGQDQDGGVGLLERIRTSPTSQEIPGVGIGALGLLQEGLAAQEAARPDASAARAQIQERLANAVQQGTEVGSTDPSGEPTTEEPSSGLVGRLSQAMQERMVADEAAETAGSAAYAQVQEQLSAGVGFDTAVAVQEQTRERLMARLAAYR